MALLINILIFNLLCVSIFTPDSVKIASGVTISQRIKWSEITSPVTSTLNTIAMVSDNEGWAAGENGTLLHYDGTAWITSSLPITTTLFSISMSSTQNGWAVGMNTSPPYDEILLRYDGLQWQSIPLANYAWLIHLTDVSVPNDSSAWISAGVIVCAPEIPCEPAAAVGGIAHWDGSLWNYMQISNVLPSSISMISDSDGWVVGTEVVQPTRELRSVILHWDGSEWSKADHPMFLYPPGNYLDVLAEVTALSASNAWVSVKDQNTFLYWDGLNWNAVFNPVRGEPSIAVISTHDAWAVGSYGDIGFWDGSNWATESSPITETLTSVDIFSHGNVWAVGYGGTILHGTNYMHYLPLSMK